VCSGLSIKVNWTIFARSYSWGARSEYRLKIGNFAPKRLLWPKIWGRQAPTNHSFSHKTMLNVLSYGVKIWANFSSVLTQCTCLTDGRTDRWTELSSIDHICIPHSEVKSKPKCLPYLLQDLDDCDKIWFIISWINFPHHLISVTTLPCKTYRSFFLWKFPYLKTIESTNCITIKHLINHLWLQQTIKFVNIFICSCRHFHTGWSKKRAQCIFLLVSFKGLDQI